MCDGIIEAEHSLWSEIQRIAGDDLETLVRIQDGREMVADIEKLAGAKELTISGELKDALELTKINYYPKGRNSALAFSRSAGVAASAKAAWADSTMAFNSFIRCSLNSVLLKKG